MLDTTQEPTTVMTRGLRAALRHADSFCLDFDGGTVTIRLSKRIESSDPFENGRARSLLFPGFPGRTARGHLDRVYQSDDRQVWYSDGDGNDYEPASGCWVITSCQFHAELMTAFASIPTGAELSFTVALDALSNGYCARARLHGDVLRMTERKGKILRTFILDASVCAHNSARFGYRL